MSEMIGEISKRGDLSIDRAGLYELAFCPFCISRTELDDNREGLYMRTDKKKAYDYGYKVCGDWCAHFGEPHWYADNGGARIDLCNGKTLVFKSLNDLREGRNDWLHSDD